jgi:uncharacterized protein (DUF952 family)/SAM-dependent methyltransferase
MTVPPSVPDRPVLLQPGVTGKAMAAPVATMRIVGRAILHIVDRDAWTRAVRDGVYPGDTLDTQGFIHCSYPHQAVRVADALFTGRTDLLLLVIDADQVAESLRDESFEPGGEAFPHVYGPLPLDAVIEVLPFEAGTDGRFRFPYGEMPYDWYSNEEDWYEGVRAWLEPAYLAATDPYRGSGFGGGADRWEHDRRPIAEAIDRDGSFLDVGCANGLLLESVVRWAAERGHRIEPFGLDISERLAALALERIGRAFVGNVMTWEPPRRFDYVRTELVYAPTSRRPDLVGRLLRQFLTERGRLIVCSYGSSSRARPAEDVAADLRSWGHTVDGTATAQVDGVVVTRVAWLSPTGS